MAGRGDTLKWFQDARPAAQAQPNLTGGGSFWSSGAASAAAQPAPGATAPVAPSPAGPATPWAGMSAMFGRGAQEGTPASPQPGQGSGLFGSFTAQPDEWACGLSQWQRLQVFLLLMAAAAVLLGMALFVFLPMALVFPGKFAMTFTVGSLAFMAAFAMLRGPRTMAASLFAPDRAVFTTAYLGSMLLTLYATFVAKTYLLIMLATGVQSAALAWYGASYVPGGAAGMSWLSGLCWRVTTSTARGVASQVSSAASGSG